MLAREEETIYAFGMVVHQYLWIDQFVWACAFCGTRKHQSASVDCSGVIRKIHMRKIRLLQDVARASENYGFHDMRPLDKAQ